MGLKCIVVNCNNSQKDAKMHVLPSNSELFMHWIKVAGREDIKIEKRDSYRICHIHFADNMTFLGNRNKTNLKVGAVPTLFLPNTQVGENLYVQKQQLYEETELEQVGDINTSPVAEKFVQPETQIRRRTRRDIRRKVNLLKHVDVFKQSQLSPKAHKLYKTARGLLLTSRKLYSKNASNKQRLRKITESIESGELFADKINTTTLRFIQSQLKLQRRKPRGRRFVLEDKLFALSLLKQGPKTYRLLQKIFALPSRKTLTTLLNKIPFSPGINAQIINALKQDVQKMDKLDRVCSLLFDEMTLEASLFYNIKKDCIDGFETLGGEQTPKFADHVTVFMARGLRKKWKQPICFYFTENGMKVTDLVREIKLIIGALMDIGLKVVATVCDQSTTNCAAINKLLEDFQRNCLQSNEENRLFGFSVKSAEVVPLYDCPHMLKGIRNNFIDANVRFQWKVAPQIAKWQYLIKLYELDVGDCDTKMLYKLTDEHVYKDKLKKMKVKHAAQVLSHSVSSTMRGLVKFGNGCLPSDAIDTADFIMFMDKLFDSVNGAAINPQHGKLLRCAVKSNSGHVDFWYEAINVLCSVKFVTETRQYTPPSLKNWIFTLQGLIYLWKKLKIMGFGFLSVRNLNQDPVENFFSCIRSHGGRNINPSCTAFTSSFKSLLVNNFSSSHSPGANCEEDESEGAINTLKQLLIKNNGEVDGDGVYITEPAIDDKFILSETTDGIVINNHSYIAGYIVRSVLKRIKRCEECRSNLISSSVLCSVGTSPSIAKHYAIMYTPTEGHRVSSEVSSSGQVEHQLIEHRAYSIKCLTRPKTEFTKLFSKCLNVLHYYLPKMCHQSNLNAHLLPILMYYTENNFTCTRHELYKIVLSKCVTFYVHMWIHNVNNILKGKDIRHVNDPIKLLAFQRYKKYKTRREAVRKMKGLQ